VLMIVILLFNLLFRLYMLSFRGVRRTAQQLFKCLC